MEIKLKSGRYMVPVTVTKVSDRLELNFKYNPKLLEEIRCMEGAKYHGYDEGNPRKIWSILDSSRNQFQLQYLAHPANSDPENPYHIFDKPLVEFKPNRPVYGHQFNLSAFGLTRHYCIFAAEMGTGKTLAAIEMMEASGAYDWIWVGPKSALVSVKIEFRKWKCKIKPTFVTYEGLKKLLSDWPVGKPPPQGVIFDESSRLKNFTAQRTQAAKYLADNIRSHWGEKGFVILMSGSPAPKSPVDWWSQCEIACPGFIREGTPEKFKRRLAIMETRESFIGGGAYSHLVAWRDDETKCNICGLPESAETHSDSVDVHQVTAVCHKFQKAVNEVALLYKRMNGLVNVKFKRDCIDLPDKVYRILRCKPTHSIMNAAKAIQAKAASTIEGLTLLRELSDGFQYIETLNGVETCPRCHGRKTVEVPYDKKNPDNFPSQEEFARGCRMDDEGNPTDIAIEIAYRTESCPTCHESGVVDSYIRSSTQIPTPKEGVLKDLMDEHDEIGRLVIYGGFQGSVDRIVSIVQSMNWHYVKVDGRGWSTDLPFTSDEAMVEAFQFSQNTFEKIAFIGQPGSAGMGLTLTASPSIVYYSNDFNGESRIQSEDRIHRLGMDLNRGATIYDIFHLPSDEYVYDNLKVKKRLQDISMGEMVSAISSITANMEREF